MYIQTSHFSIAAYAKGNENAGKVALVLPGFLDSKDYAHVRSHVKFLAERGYYAVGIDLPGTWKSSGTIKDFTITNSLEVLDEIINAFGRPTLIAGHSNGGRLALHMAVRNPLVQAVVAIMSPLRMMRKDEPTETMKLWIESGVRISMRDLPSDPEKAREYRVPITFLEDSQSYTLTDEIPKITVPKLFIAGMQDVIIAPEEVHEAFTLANEPKSYKQIEFGHNYRKYTDSIAQVNSIIGQFITEYC